MIIKVKLERYKEHNMQFIIHIMRLTLNDMVYGFNYKEDSYYQNGDSRFIDEIFSRRIDEIIISYIKEHYVPKRSTLICREVFHFNSIINSNICSIPEIIQDCTLDLEHIAYCLDFLYTNPAFYVQHKREIVNSVVGLVNEDNLREQYPEEFI